MKPILFLAFLPMFVECLPRKYDSRIQSFVLAQDDTDPPQVEDVLEPDYKARNNRHTLDTDFSASDKYFDPYLSEEVPLGPYDDEGSYEGYVDPYDSGEVPPYIPRPVTRTPHAPLPYRPVPKDHFRPTPKHRQPIRLNYPTPNPKDILPIPEYVTPSPKTYLVPSVKPAPFSGGDYSPVQSSTPYPEVYTPIPSKPQLRVKPISQYPSLESVQAAISHSETAKHDSSPYESKDSYDGHEHKGRVSFQIHGHQGPNSYRFGYDAGKGSNRHFRYEERDNDGYVRGRYGYYDHNGKLFAINYSADPKSGFKVDLPPH